MTSRVLACPQCGVVLAPDFWDREKLTPCPGCRLPIQLHVFPAQFRAIERGPGSEAAAAEEASCFYHPAKKAAATCDHCGRFLCALCDVSLAGEHLCPACLDVGQKKGRLKNLQRERLVYDRLALLLAVAPLLIWPLTLLTAPAAIYVAIRYWRRPGSIVGGGNGRKIVAILFGLAEIIGWAALFFAMKGAR